MRALRTLATATALATVGVLGSAGAGTYTVRPGDRLEQIARRHGVPTAALASANGISDPNRIYAGMTLQVPGAAAPAPAPAATYTVRPGDTLARIARRHGVDVAALAAANGISDPNVVRLGATLVVPGGAAAGAAPAPAPAPATTRYTVLAGDSLERIARRHGVGVRALAAANDLDDANLIRVGTTLVVPVAGPGGPAPQAGPPSAGPNLPARLRASPERLALLPVFDRWAAAYGVPADVLKAMTWMESGWQNHVVSRTGAVGIGQLMPDTVTFVHGLLGERLDPSVAEHNIRMSARFLAFLLAQTGGRLDQALAGYYQGLASVRARGMLLETVTYVETIQALRPRFG